MPKYSSEELIFLLGILIAVILVKSPYEYIDGNPVPLVIFRRKPALFHAFLIVLSFGFTAAIMTMSLRVKSPTVAQFCRRSAVACVAAAAGVLSCSVFPT